MAVERAGRQTLSDTAAAFVRTLLSLLVSTMPLVISWGTLVLLVAKGRAATAEEAVLLGVTERAPS